MLYKTLNRTKAKEYKADIWEELGILYRGGYEILDQVKRFLPKLCNEGAARYRERLSSAAYLGYFGEIVDSFAADLFRNSLTVLPPSDDSDKSTPGESPDMDYYQSFATNADRMGKNFEQVCKEAFTWALVNQRAIICVDFPNLVEPFSSRADEKKFGEPLAYAWYLPVEALLNWHVGPHGLDWAIIKTEVDDQPSPESDVPVGVEEFKIWRHTAEGVTWELYRTRPLLNKRDSHKDTEDVALVDSGTSSFKRIPLVFLELPHGLWVGNKIGLVAREHFARRTTLVSAENRSMVSVPVVALGPEMSAPGEAMPSEIQQNPNRATDQGGPMGALEAAGFMVTGKDDKVYFAEPEGKAYKLVRGELIDLKDEMFRITHQLAAAASQSSATSLGRSGVSKKSDKEAMFIVLTAFAALVAKAATAVYDIISTARDEDVKWRVHGLSGFDGGDRWQLLEEAKAVGIIDIPSKTFQKAYKSKLAVELLDGGSPEELETIRAEIRNNVDKQPDEGAVDPNQLKDILANRAKQLGGTRMPMDRAQPPNPTNAKPALGQ